VEAARQVALDYAKSLPDFLCTQTIHRYQGIRPERRVDTLTVEVSFQQHGDQYTLTHIDGLATAKDFDRVGGATSTGEFGSNMLNVFGPRAAFRFERWTTFLQRPAAVYSYRVARSESPYQLRFWDGRNAHAAVVGLRGEVVIDRETHGILRIEYVSDDVAPLFPMTSSSTVEYDYARIGEQRYLLPAKAVVKTTFLLTNARNEVEFHAYRKFDSESSIRFGDDAPPPEP
jgi:hypothetical protein